MIKQKTEYTYFCDTEEEVKSLVLFLFSINKDISYIVKSVKRKDIGANQAEYIQEVIKQMTKDNLVVPLEKKLTEKGNEIFLTKEINIERETNQPKY
jgi:hypothetical protein